MRCLSRFLLVLLAVLSAIPAAAQTRTEKACLVAELDRNTVAACNRLIAEINRAIEQLTARNYKPPKGKTRDGLLSAAYNLRGGAYQRIARRHAANEETEKANRFHLRAIQDFDTALRHDPASPHAYLNRGRSRAELIELDSAIKDFDEALRLDPNNAQKTNALAFNNRGGAHRGRGDEADALADLERALRLDPKNANAIFNRGTVHLEKERYDRAIADYTDAMRLGLKDIDAYNARGRARRDSGDYKGAVGDFEAALKLTAADKRSRSVQDAVRELLRALREKAEREDAERRRAEAEAAARKEAAAAAEAARREAEAAEIARRKAAAAEIARQKAAAEAAAREEAARQKEAAAAAARKKAQEEAAARREAARKEAAEKAAQAEAARKEALAAEAARKEAQRQEAQRRKEAEEEARRAEAARKEAERLKADRRRAEELDAQRRKEAEEKAARERLRRVALVIGNSDYRWLGRLNNPRNDAEDVGKALESLNFTVFRGIDLTHARMKEVLTSFEQAVQTAEVALFFFAGHGIQNASVNYLAPIDAGTADPGQFVDLQAVVASLSRGDGIRILIIDACRNNPAVAAPRAGGVATRAITGMRGLAQLDVSGSKNRMFVAFATQPGEVAADGVGRNSPFTRGILVHLETPGLELRRLFVRVRDEVLMATGGKQNPHISDSLKGEFYFAATK
jgi:tetratricopeptide (TPR) repeat protein